MTIESMARMVGITVSLSAVIANASPTVALVPATIDATARTWCQFADDALTAEIRDGTTVLSSYRFCSSYGKAAADLTVDRRGHQYLLLRFAEGRGPNATTGYLGIFRVAPELVEYVRVPISSGSGPTSRWEYQYRVTAPRRGGLRLSLDLRLDPQTRATFAVSRLRRNGQLRLIPPTLNNRVEWTRS